MIGRRKDPFADVDSLIRDLYAYVAYRVGDDSEAEEITSTVLERAVRYRKTYDRGKGTPIAWLIGIARTQIAEHRRQVAHVELDPETTADDLDLEDESIDRLALRDAVGALDDRSRDLIALRYGVGLSPREIAADLGLEENAVNVALHRARARLRANLENGATPRRPRARPASDPM